jgi:hypothetical protein
MEEYKDKLGMELKGSKLQNIGESRDVTRRYG